jgi:hemolysin activation/secretion protein
MIAGGAYTVRAYDMGALSADTGILASAEWRHDLGVHWHGRMQAVGFADREHVTINHTVWVAGPNSATLSDAGVGLNWSWSSQWNAKASIAAPLGSTPTLIGTNNSARIWLALSKGF